MKNMLPTAAALQRPLPLALCISVALVTWPAHVGAGTTDISSTPLIVSTPNSVKANILFVIDDSGSMNFDFLPDHVAGDGTPDPKICRSAGATSKQNGSSADSSGSFGNACCQDATGGGNASAACWTGTAPFTNRGAPPFLASAFNGVAYNPELRYLPPVDSAGNDYPSQTSANTSAWAAVRNDYFQVQSTGTINLVSNYPDTAWCTDALHGDCLRNGNYTLPGTVNGKNYTTYWATTASGTGKVTTGAPDASGTSDTRTFGPHYYKITPGEYCTGDDLRTCQTTQTTAYNTPSYVRWCKVDSAGKETNTRVATPESMSCQAARTSTFKYPRYPTRFFSAGAAAVAAVTEVPASVSFTVSMGSGCKTTTTTTGSGSNKVTTTTTVSAGVGSLTVGTVDLFGGVATPQEITSSSLATDIAARINAKTSTTGYSATVSGSTVKITAPTSAGKLTSTASLTRASASVAACTFTPTTTSAFSGYVAPVTAVAATTGTFPGSFSRVDIVSGGTYTKAAGRTDCAGSTCTYDEEMTNFANWWAYYHSRMQSMKTSASRAFSAISTTRRVGYMSINNATKSDFLNLDTFDSTQKSSWYSKLFSTKPDGSTPLRAALSKAGRLYAGKYNGNTLNGVTATDPMQYSCQKNFTILSTDGYWNESADPVKMDGTTSIGDQDSALARPLFDGKATANTLADTAYYYYSTDLRTGTTGTTDCLSGSTGADVCGNGKTYSLQNMRTFTLGLGASGYMQFNSSYLSATSGDFYSVKQGLTANPSTGVCSWQASGETCNWPAPVNNTLTAVDDLWHAAVNGNGTYFSASDPSSLYAGLTTALSSIDMQTGAAAAATTSNPNITSSDNAVYLTYFNSGEWSGEVEARTINTTTGAVSTGDPTWSAATLLDANTSRTLYMFTSDTANHPSKLKSFAWSSMTTAEKAYFALSYITSTTNGALSQFCSTGAYCLSSDGRTAAAGEALVGFLAGDRTHEGEVSDATAYYRKRTHVLGDIVNSESVYVKGANYSYADASYTTFKASTAIKGRAAMLYVAANDGMLHAINATTGAEAWAYVPTAGLPYLYKLADKEYASNHRYYVDSTPAVQDIKIGDEWRTILVGGLGAGGRAYYALDVTDPSAPKALWEYTDTNLGYTFGKPEIGKLSDGTWAVFFASGYNNVSTGDGVGRLYVVNAATGELIRSISTGAGSTTTPSGLAHIRAWVDNSDTDNTVQRVYAGDNLGYLWRFDVNNTIGASGYDAQRLATLKTSTGVGQPVTSRPELGEVGTVAMVFVGTGRYLGATDFSDSTTQSIYGIKDRLSAEDFGNPRDSANSFVQQTLVDSECPASSSFCTSTDTVRSNSNPQPVDLSTNGGWYVDLPKSYERVNTDPQLALGTLVVNSNIISTADVCLVGGSSYVNYFDYRTGTAVSTANGLVSVYLGNAIATRPSLVKLPSGKVVSVTRLSNNKTVVSPIPVQSASGTTRRLSWRDLIQN